MLKTFVIELYNGQKFYVEAMTGNEATCKVIQNNHITLKEIKATKEVIH